MATDHFFTGRQRSCGKEMFSVMCVILSTVQGPGLPPPDIFKLVQLGPHCVGLWLTPDPARHVQTCSLGNADYRKAGGWHSTEMPSCWSSVLLFQFISLLNSCAFIPGTLMLLNWLTQERPTYLVETCKWLHITTILFWLLLLLFFFSIVVRLFEKVG